MRRIVTGLALALSFVVGCMASRTVVRGAHAEERPRWEYACIDGYAGVTHSSNQLGKEGWEMAAAAGTSDHMMWCFKRPMP